MKKRIVCILLTLIMLVSLVPAAALNAAAATNAVSESAIYVLKQLEGYSKECDGMYIGYGTKCPKADKKGHDATCTEAMFEKEADVALREELKALDTAVNNFASRSGLSFSQSQHDALVLFSFANGTAWTMGTGAFQTAIKSGYTGSKFLDAIGKWNYSPDDDLRRMVEANMYLNGVYSATKPSRFIRVTFHVEEAEGTMNEDPLQYFDVATPANISLVPTPVVKDTSFQGWYTEATGGERVSALTSKHHDLTLYALWQDDTTTLGKYDNYTGQDILYTIKKSALSSTTVYNAPNGDKITKYINHNDKEVAISLGDTLNVTADYVDAKGVRWVRLVDVYTRDPADGGDIVRFIGWVILKGTASSGSGASAAMDVTVSVTNTYVNMRNGAGVTKKQIGTCYQGEQLRIVSTKHASSDSFLWGEVAHDDGNTRGWVALMYTNYDSVVAGMGGTSVSKGNVIGTATITYNGYVNVRSDAGLNNQIVGALSQNVTVDLYQVKYVNSVMWGLTDTGWFCLSYAKVSNLSSTDTNTSAEGFSNFVFEATYNGWADDVVPSYVFYKEVGGSEHVEPILSKRDDGSEYEKPMASADLVLTNLVDLGGDDEWAKTTYGWISMSEVTLKTAKFYVIADSVTVRDSADTASDRVDVIIKGTEFLVSEIDIVGSDITGVNNTIWGKADKVGETSMTYGGYVNLANDNVSRNGVPEYSIGGSESSTATTVKMARVVGTERLRVRITGATYGKQIGTLTYGTTAAVLEEKDGWYNLDIDVDNDPSTGSWVSGQYLEFFEGTVGGENSTNSSASGTVETGKGIVANTYTGVNIRTAPGTGNPAVGKYMVGTVVDIYEVRTHGSAKWGRTEKGWVCMDYIVMTEYSAPAGSGSTGSSTTTGSEVAIYTGRAVGDVKIYKTTNENDNNVVRTIADGEPITLHELLIVEREPDTEINPEDNAGNTTTIIKEYWARVNEGYIFAPGTHGDIINIELDTLDEHVYTVANDTTELYDSVDGSEIDITLKKGEKVIVTELGIAKANVWGKVERADYNEVGWTKLSNMTKGFASSTAPEQEETKEDSVGSAEPTTPSTVVGSTGNITTGAVGATGSVYTGKVIRTNTVNVRATASTSATATTTLKSGATLNIYETVISEGMAWGRCDAGWVYLYYVDLTPVGNGAVDAKVVYTENTPIYSDMNLTSPTGSTYTRMAVVNIYEVVGKASRTDLGWVSSDNLG